MFRRASGTPCSCISRGEIARANLDPDEEDTLRALAPKIRVVAVSPGLVDTELAKNFDPVWRADQIDKTPLKRLASPDDVGKAVVAVATHLTFTTGAIIPVDGGRPIA